MGDMNEIQKGSYDSRECYPGLSCGSSRTYDAALLLSNAMGYVQCLHVDSSADNAIIRKQEGTRKEKSKLARRDQKWFLDKKKSDALIPSR